MTGEKLYTQAEVDALLKTEEQQWLNLLSRSEESHSRSVREWSDLVARMFQMMADNGWNVPGYRRSAP